MPQTPLSLAKQLIEDDLCLESQVALLNNLQLDPDNVNGEHLGMIAELFRAHSHRLTDVPSDAVDLVGTGGDGAQTFNISTVATFVAAGAGVTMAKHGNRSVTSRCGSFDCLQALDIHIPSNAAQASTQLNQYKLTFLFAPYFHPIMQRFAAARKVLATRGQKTLFNILGPLLNPACVTRQVVGVASLALIAPMAQALQYLGITQASIVHGDGLDEATLTGETHITRLHHGKITQQKYQPEALGFSRCRLTDLQGDDIASNTNIATAILNGQEQGAKRDIVLLNAALAIQLAHDKLPLIDAIELAKQSIQSGAALAKLKSVRKEHHDT